MMCTAAVRAQRFAISYLSGSPARAAARPTLRWRKHGGQ